MSDDKTARALAAVALLMASVALLAWQINNERPSCFCECVPDQQGPQGERGPQGPVGPQGEPGESCECDPSNFATTSDLAFALKEMRETNQKLRDELAARCACPKCCTAPAGPLDECEPTPAKRPPEVLPTPKPQPQSRVKRRCVKWCCR